MTHRDDLHDDQALDAHLKRNSELSRRYKNLPQDEVPPELDQKILMQARKAVSDRKVVTHHSWWIRWNKPLALAASLMLAFTVIYKAGHQSIDRLVTSAPEAPAIVQQKTTSGRAAEVADQVDSSVTVEPKPEAFNEPKRVREKDAQDTRGYVGTAKLRSPSAARSRPVPAPVVAQAKIAEVPIPVAQAPAAPPATASPATDKASPSTAGASSDVESKPHEAQAVVDDITAEDVGRLPDSNVSESLQRIPGVEIKQEERSALKKKQDKADPEQLLQHIRDLRKQGKKKQADNAWKKFRKDFPDYPVADDDKARSESR